MFTHTLLHIALPFADITIFKNVTQLLDVVQDKWYRYENCSICKIVKIEIDPLLTARNTNE